MEAGTIVTLKVVRTAPFGYFLSDGTTDVLLHASEAKGTYEPEDEVDVYLYHDHQGRLTATRDKAILLLGECGWLQVTDTQFQLGAFLDNGIQKHLFLSLDDLPWDHERWPQAGDRIPVCVGVDKKGRLQAFKMDEENIKFIAEPGRETMKNHTVQGYVYKVLNSGAWLMTEGKNIAFISWDDASVSLRLGCRIEGRVTRIREDGAFGLSMLPPKEVRYVIDAEKIYEYLKGRNGKMPYTDQSDPEIIRDIFGISKGSFKKALGKLMKENKIVQENGWTKIIK